MAAEPEYPASTRRRYIADGLSRFIQELIETAESAERERDTWKVKAEQLREENRTLKENAVKP